MLLPHPGSAQGKPRHCGALPGCFTEWPNTTPSHFSTSPIGPNDVVVQKSDAICGSENPLPAIRLPTLSTTSVRSAWPSMDRPGSPNALERSNIDTSECP